MKNYLVLYRAAHAAPGDQPESFSCMAEDLAHAQRQCGNAYPGSNLIWTYEVREGHYQPADVKVDEKEIRDLARARHEQDHAAMQAVRQRLNGADSDVRQAMQDWETVCAEVIRDMSPQVLSLEALNDGRDPDRVLVTFTNGMTLEVAPGADFADLNAEDLADDPFDGAQWSAGGAANVDVCLGDTNRKARATAIAYWMWGWRHAQWLQVQPAPLYCDDSDNPPFIGGCESMVDPSR